jgi:hypothetical protein
MSHYKQVLELKLRGLRIGDGAEQSVPRRGGAAPRWLGSAPLIGGFQGR